MDNSLYPDGAGLLPCVYLRCVHCAYTALTELLCGAAGSEFFLASYLFPAPDVFDRILVAGGSVGAGTDMHSALPAHQKASGTAVSAVFNLVQFCFVPQSFCIFAQLKTTKF